MPLNEPAGSKFKRACIEFSNQAVLTKSATLGDIQITYVHASIGNKYIGKTVASFFLVVSLEASPVVLIDSKRGFSGDAKKIHIPSAEVLLRAGAGNLDKLKKL